MEIQRNPWLQLPFEVSTFYLSLTEGLSRPYSVKLSRSEQIGHIQEDMAKWKEHADKSTNKEIEGGLGMVQTPRYERQFGKRIDKTQ